MEKIEGLPGDKKIIAIDGRCASGKTTLSRELSEALGCGVIHMDDFFLPPGLRTERRLSEPGGNVHYERFASEVLPRLGERKGFAYRRFDCRSMEPGEECVVPEGEIRIVEGAYSCHPLFGNYMTLKVFCDVGPEEQLKRIAARNGEQALAVFRERWIPMEERYFKFFSVKEGSDMVI